MYESFYNLEGKPFALSPDPRFFFASSGHKRVLSYLRYGVSQAEGFIVVTGDVGTGKTTLVQMLLAEVQSKKDMMPAHLVTTQLDPDDLLRMVASTLGVEHEGLTKSAILNAIHHFLMTELNNGRRVLLILDEAQNIPPHSLEELRMLSNFQAGQRSLLQSFLVGQAEFRETMRSPQFEQLRQRVIAAYHLGPMNLEETKAYIEHRLRQVSWHNDPAFTEDSYTAIYDYTGGIPRRINTLCDRILLYAYIEELHDVGADTVKTVTEELDMESAAAKDAADTAAAKPGSAGSEMLEERLERLEQRLTSIEGMISKSRDFLRSLLSQG